MVYMVTLERIGSPEVVVIYFASKTYYLQKALPINHSLSQPFCLVTQREGAVRDKTKQLHGPRTNFLLAQPVIVSSRKAPPYKGVKEVLRDKTKSCWKGLTCRYNNTKSWYCHKSLPIARAHQMEPPSPSIYWVNPFPSRFISRTACFPRKVSYFRESRMPPWKNKVGLSRIQKPVLRPFSFFTIRPFLWFYSRWYLGIMK